MPKGKLGILVAGRWRYPLTETDVLWAGRMVEGETLPGRPRRTEDALAVLWTMTSLFSPAGQHAKYGGRRYHTFTAQIRAYSQPINPAWAASGRFCRPGGRYHGTDRCSPNRLAARAELHRLPWRAIDPELRSVVLAWAQGRTKNPMPKVIEFAHGPVAQSFLERNPGSARHAVIQNWFLTTASSARWAGDLIRIQPAKESALFAPLAAAVLAAAAGGLLGWSAHRIQERRED